MTDIRLKEYASLEGVTMDFLLRENGFLDEREELATAVRVALGTDALVEDGDVLPDPDSTDRRGWWGDFEAEEIWGGWPIGCKNWLLTRAKITESAASEGSTVQRARNYTLAALQPFLDKRVASDVTADAKRTELNRIEVDTKIFRGPEPEIDLRYQLLWKEEPADDDLRVVPPPVNRVIRIPYRSLTITSTGPLMAIHPLSANLRITTTPPMID